MSVIDDYLAQPSIGANQKAALERIRQFVRKTVPEAEETIGYGMPVFKVRGKYLIGFAAFKDHMSIFPGAKPIAATKAKLKDYKTSKGTVQFTLDRPLSDELLGEIVEECRNNIPNR